jgi:hypothetical protein
MEDENFKNMILFGLSNIQWMLAQLVKAQMGKGQISDSAMCKANNFHDLTRKYIKKES